MKKRTLSNDWIEEFLPAAGQTVRKSASPDDLQKQLRVVADLLAGAPRELPSPALLFRGGDGATRVHALSEKFTFGRDRGCALSCPDYREISRLHFSIEVAASRVQLNDHSANGTFVQGRRVRCCELKSGDVIRAGDFVFVLVQD